jgi:hypothetical protein
MEEPIEQITQNIKLVHTTTTEVIYTILTMGGELYSPQLLKEIGLMPPNKHFDEPLAIYFTPIYIQNFEPLINEGAAIFVRFNESINRYPSFFINDDNNFRPMTGDPKMVGPKNNKKPSCECQLTYNQNLEILTNADGTNKYPPIEAKQCYLPFDNMIRHIKNTYTNVAYPIFVEPINFNNHCHDGGLEIGFITDRFNLEGLLTHIVLGNRNDMNPISVRRFTTRFGKSLDELYADMKEATERMGGLFIELPPKNARGKNKFSKKRYIKKGPRTRRRKGRKGRKSRR